MSLCILSSCMLQRNIQGTLSPGNSGVWEWLLQLNHISWVRTHSLYQQLIVAVSKARSRSHDQNTEKYFWFFIFALFASTTLIFLSAVWNRCSIYHKALRKIRFLLILAKQHKVHNPIKEFSDGFLGCLRSLWIYQVQRGKIGHCLLHSHLQINNTINRTNT